MLQLKLFLQDICQRHYDKHIEKAPWKALKNDACNCNEDQNWGNNTALAQGFRVGVFQDCSNAVSLAKTPSSSGTLSLFSGRVRD